MREDIKNNFESIKSLANANGYRFSESIGKLLDKYNKEYTYIRYTALEDKPIPKEKNSGLFENPHYFSVNYPSY